MALVSKPGITGASAKLSIPKDWDQNWFRSFISNYMQGADVRNAIGSGGIVISGTIASPYATIGFGAPVTLPGPVTITDATGGTNSLTVKAPSFNGVSSNTGRAAVFLGAPNNYTVEIDGSATSGQSYGLYVSAGTTSADNALLVQNQSGGTAYLQIRGDGFIQTTLSSASFSGPQLAVLASSGGDYPSIGYNEQATTVSGSYKYIVSDFASRVRFNLGGILFETAASGTAGNTITWTTVGSFTQAGIFTVLGGASLITTTNALTNGSGACAGTLTNAPAAGNPTKWIAINDGGTTRHIPAW